MSIPLTEKRAANLSETTDTGRPALWTQPWLHITILLTIIAFCFARTVGSYFLADDFGDIGYLSNACRGDWGMLWSNFTGNLMQIPGMNVYRPWQMMDAACDWVLFRAEARGYYATNLLYFSGCVSLFYFLTRRLFSQWGTSRASSAALFASILFAASPLRCESVSWMCGRVDIVSGFFYLTAFFIYVRTSNWHWRALGTVSFLLALLTKEMPVGLPFVVCAAYLVCGESAGLENSGLVTTLLQRIGAAMRHTAALWAILIAYFIVRTTCLGTVTGGYVGGFGDTSLASLVHKWTDPDTIHRIFFPFNFAVLPEPNIYARVLACGYVALSVLLLIRALSNSIFWRYLALFAVWMGTAAAPIYQLWGLGYNLQGSRFYYFLCMPLTMTLSALVFAPYSFVSLNEKFTRRLTYLGTAVLVIICAVMVRITAVTDSAWVNAGKEVRKFADACVNLATNSPDGQIVVLGVPQERGGAHQILNGITFNTMLGPPFQPKHFDRRFINFAPVMFGREDLINQARLRSCLAAKLPIYTWNGKELRSLALPDSVAPAPQPLNLTATTDMTASASGETVGHGQTSTSSSGITLSDAQSDDGLAFTGLKVNPWQYDFLHCDITASAAYSPAQLRAVWAAPHERINLATATTNFMLANIEPTSKSGSQNHYSVSIPLSHSWRWFANPQVGTILILPGGAQSIKFSNVKLVAASQTAPQLSIQGDAPNSAGIVSTRSNRLTVAITSPPQKSDTYELQVSRKNFFIDNFDYAHADTPIGDKLFYPGTSKTIDIYGAQFDKLFPASGYYQLRVRSCSPDHKPVGDFSDLGTVSIERTAVGRNQR